MEAFTEELKRSCASEGFRNIEDIDGVLLLEEVVNHLPTKWDINVGQSYQKMLLEGTSIVTIDAFATTDRFKEAAVSHIELFNKYFIYAVDQHKPKPLIERIGPDTEPATNNYTQLMNASYENVLFELGRFVNDYTVLSGITNVLATRFDGKLTITIEGADHCIGGTFIQIDSAELNKLKHDLQFQTSKNCDMERKMKILTVENDNKESQILNLTQDLSNAECARTRLDELIQLKVAEIMSALAHRGNGSEPEPNLQDKLNSNGKRPRGNAYWNLFFRSLTYKRKSD